MKHRRLEEIELFLMKKHSSNVLEIAEHFDISITTVRRDLDILQKKGVIKKEYGGVLYANQQNNLIPYNERIDTNKEKKEYIGKLASELIENNDCVFIDSGTTTKYIIDYLENKNVTIITNNLYVIEKCMSMVNINLIVLGGELNRDTNALIGATALDTIKNFNIRKAFLATTGYAPDTGFTNALSEETDMKKCVIANCNNVHILIDDTKWGKVAIRTFVNFNESIKIITNEKPKKYQDFYNKHKDSFIF